MSRGNLPLDSPNWVLVDEIHRELAERVGNPHLAARDLTEVFAKKGKKGVRTMRRWLGRAPFDARTDKTKPLPPELLPPPERELSPSGYWTEHELQSWSDGLLAVPRVRRGTNVPPREFIFYAWAPDLKKIFSWWRVASPALSEQAPEVPTKRGSPGRHDRAELAAMAFALAVHRRGGGPEKDQATVINELRDWCEQEKRNVPADSTLAEIVSAALRIRKALKRRPLR
jgi:hypothetical protein